MPMYLPIPEGLEIPETGTFDLVTTFENREGQLYPIAVDGIPFPEMEDQEAPEAEAPEMEMEVEMEAPEGEGEAAGPDSFMAAIEKAMAKKQQK